MSRKLSLLVWHRVEDLIATTAEETIRNRHENGAKLETLSREEHWRFTFDGNAFPARLDDLVARSRLFVNPNKHAFRIVDEPEDGRAFPGAIVRVRNREDIEGATAMHSLRPLAGTEELTEVVFETVWFVRLAPSVEPDEIASLVESYAVTHTRHDGLLVNPHFQDWSLTVVPGTQGARA